MRPSPRIVSALAGLAIAAGGIVISAPAAHADLGDCTTYLQSRGFETTDVARTACYYGLVGNQSGCVKELTQLGIQDSVATEGCHRAAP
ncbi:hypothetical protein [Kitasatospora sp. GP82]|uniref:hypothetical protein n=1 Tax=Kitasatospora sp. GP82 TaxID=3035089 RepID=UPI00247564E6|nr:hypothetical protein [Kitasatospora sp. GP82]MDH6126756.1 hypothetical protein [Kitasatospora sp. GP82]